MLVHAPAENEETNESYTQMDRIRVPH